MHKTGDFQIFGKFWCEFMNYAQLTLSFCCIGHYDGWSKCWHLVCINTAISHGAQSILQCRINIKIATSKVSTLLMMLFHSPLNILTLIFFNTFVTLFHSKSNKNCWNFNVVLISSYVEILTLKVLTNFNTFLTLIQCWHCPLGLLLQVKQSIYNLWSAQTYVHINLNFFLKKRGRSCRSWHTPLQRHSNDHTI